MCQLIHMHMQETLYQQEMNKSQLTGNKATAGIGNHCLVHRVEMVDLDIIVIIRWICDMCMHICITRYFCVDNHVNFLAILSQLLKTHLINPT